MSTNSLQITKQNEINMSNPNSISLYLQHILHNIYKEDSLTSYSDEHINDIIEILQTITFKFQRINKKMKHYNISENDIINSQRFIGEVRKLNVGKSLMYKKRSLRVKSKCSLTWNKENSKSK